MALFAFGRIARIPLAGLFTVTQAASYVGLSIPIGSVVGFAAAGVYEPLSGRRVNHLTAAAYGGLLMGWFVLCFCGFLVLFPVD